MVSVSAEIKAILILTVAVIGFFFIIGTVTSDDGGNDVTPVVKAEDVVRVGYTCEVVDSFESNLFGTTVPPAGYNFLVLKINVVNDSFEEGFSTDMWNWRWWVELENIRYDASSDTLEHPDYRPVTVMLGGVAKAVMVFEIPEHIKTVQDPKTGCGVVLTLEHPNFYHDKTLDY